MQEMPNLISIHNLIIINLIRHRVLNEKESEIIFIRSFIFKGVHIYIYKMAKCSHRNAVTERLTLR